MVYQLAQFSLCFDSFDQTRPAGNSNVESGNPTQIPPSPALIPVGSEQDQDLPAVSVQVRQHPREAVLEGLFDARLCGLQVLEHVQVLLSVLEVLGEQPERLEVVELAGAQEAQDKGVVRAQEADVGPRNDHVPHLLDVLVQGVRVLLELSLGLLQRLGGQTRL